MIRRAVTFAGVPVFCGSLFLATAFSQEKGGKGDATKGKDVFQQCAMCHNVDSPEKKMGPSLQGLFKKKTLQNGKPVNDANVLEQINNGGNGMPPYADQLSAQEKADVLAYLHAI